MAERGRLPELGRRGEGWVAIQALLMVAILLSAGAGLGWPHALAPAAIALGEAEGLGAHARSVAIRLNQK